MYTPFYELESNVYIPEEMQQYSDNTHDLTSYQIIMYYINKYLYGNVKSNND